MITVLAPHMGSNALGRALVLAELVDRLGHEVRIVGSTRKDGKVWAPALESHIPMETFRLTTRAGYPQAAVALRRMVKPDEIVIISKSLPTSQGLALMAGIQPSRSILDIDDWEFGFRLGKYQGSALNRINGLSSGLLAALIPRRINTDFGVFCAERLAKTYPHRTVSNTWLAEHFGGQVVRHARDERLLDPAKHDGKALRERLQIKEGERLWVAFIGTPRAHKGVDVLIEALTLLKGKDAPGLMLFGFDESDQDAATFAEQARAALGPDRLRIRGVFPMSELPDHVAAADIIVIPSLESPATRGQIPAKLFDAMAMGKAVIVSDVNDMAEILGDTGRSVPASNPPALSHTIQELCDDVEQRHDLGRRARVRFLERDSFEACANQLEHVLAPLLRRNSKA